METPSGAPREVRWAVCFFQTFTTRRMGLFDVTESAKEELHRILEIRDLEAGKFLRLATPPMWVGDGDFGIVIDEKGSHDQIVVHMDTLVLLVDLELNAHLSESLLDFVHSPEGPRFTLDVH